MNSDHGQYQDNQYEHFDDVHEDFANEKGEHFADEEEFTNHDEGEHFADEEEFTNHEDEHFADEEEFADDNEEFADDNEYFGDKKKKSKSSKMCRVVNYSVNLFGFRVNVWALILVIIVMFGALFYLQYKRLPNMSDLSSSHVGGFSSTSSMNTVHNQMGGFASSPSLSVTPSFIRNLKY